MQNFRDWLTAAALAAAVLFLAAVGVLARLWGIRVLPGLPWPEWIKWLLWGCLVC